MNSEVVIVGYVRTPIGKFGGALRNVKSPQLAAEAIKALLKRSGVEPSMVDEVIFGSTLQGGPSISISPWGGPGGSLPFTSRALQLTLGNPPFMCPALPFVLHLHPP